MSSWCLSAVTPLQSLNHPGLRASAMIILRELSLPGEFNAWAVSKATSWQTVQAFLYVC